MLTAGQIGWISSWPPWVTKTNPVGRHPFVVLAIKNGEALLAICCTQPSAVLYVSMTQKDYPSAFKPTGPLRHTTCLNVCGSDGACMDWVDVRGDKVIFKSPDGKQVLTDVTPRAVIAAEEFKSLLHAIRERAVEATRRGLSVFR